MTNQDVERTVLHDARTIHDVASMRFEDYGLDGQPSWLLAAVTPGQGSGGATIPDGYFEAETGKLVVPSGAQTSILKVGTWQTVASAPAGAHPASGSYSWYEPMARAKRFLLPEDYYSPFVGGGTVLFLPVAGKSDIEQFGSVRMIFPDWAAHVAPAFAFDQAHPHLLDPAAQTVSGPQLVQVAIGQNPLLAVVAFRGLLSHGLVQPDFVRAELVRADGSQCATLGYLTIVVPGPSGSHPFTDDTLYVLDAAGEPTVRALVLGAFAAGLFQSRDKVVLSRAKVVLLKARQRLTAAGVAIDQDVGLKYMFDRMAS